MPNLLKGKEKMKTINIEGMKKDEAMTVLIQGGLDFKAANEYWVENRPARGTGFAARFYGALETGPMSDEDFEDLITGDSANVLKHRSHYGSIRDLANKIWDAKK